MAIRITKEQYESLSPQTLAFIKQCTADSPIEFLPTKSVSQKDVAPVIPPWREVEIENLTIGILNRYFTSELQDKIDCYEKRNGIK